MKEAKEPGGSSQMGKKCGGRGRGSPNKTRVWMQRKMDAPGVGMGPGTLRGHQERTASKAGGRN